MLALTSITLTTGAAVSGRVLARNGAVTIDNNAVSLPVCTKADAGVPDASPSSDAGVTDAALPDTGTPADAATPPDDAE